MEPLEEPFRGTFNRHKIPKIPPLNATFFVVNVTSFATIIVKLEYFSSRLRYWNCFRHSSCKWSFSCHSTANEGSSFASLIILTTSNLNSLLKEIHSQSSSAPNATTASNFGSYFDDSACCNNMTSLTSAFSCLSSKNTIAYIHTDGSLEKDNQTGYISLPFLSLSNTYLVSKLNFNLIFVGQLCDLGSTLTFTSFGCFV